MLPPGLSIAVRETKAYFIFLPELFRPRLGGLEGHRENLGQKNEIWIGS
jgi:hypothetical protein